jgi:hypothetical protein
MVGDFELWNILSQRYNVVLLPGDAVWYRVHNEGEMQYAKDNTFQMFEYLITENNILNSINCPLTEMDRSSAIKKCQHKQSRYILRNLKSSGIMTALKLQKMSSLSILDVLIKALIKI